VRYDAAIIGAGANGLAAATALARAGLTAIVIERSDRAGGRLSTREFHPGFRASPFLDELAPIPQDIFWSLGLAQRGADLMPAPVSLALWPDRLNLLRAGGQSGAAALLALSAALAAEALAHALGEAERQPQKRLFFRPQPMPWPGVEAMLPSLNEILMRRDLDPDTAAHVAAIALSGRAADPFLPGGGVHLLAPGAGMGGMVAGGFGKLADALVRAARDAGAQIVYGLDASGIAHANDRLTGVTLADGSFVAARAVISTLDLKRTFLSLFSRNELPVPVARQVDNFRMAGSTARVLFAIERAPAMATAEALRGPIYVSPDLEGFAAASMSWRAGRIAPKLPVTLRIPSLMDPSLAVPGGAVMTATFGAVPHRPADGAWTREMRDVLRDMALGALESVMPGMAGRVSAAEIIVPGDMEDAFGTTAGDLWGGEIAADQMLDLRPWPDCPRTLLKGLYLGGSSAAAGPLATCAAGIAAARAVSADLKRGKLS